MVKTGVKEKEYKYDFSKKTVNERVKFLEDKIGYILDCPSHLLMGYSSSSRKSKYKNDRLPKLIDTYTAYFLRANDAGSSKKIEYSFYIDDHDEILRKKNVLFKKADSFEGSQKNDGDNSLNYNETYTEDSVHELDDVNSHAINLAIESNKMTVSEYKKLLSMSLDILANTKDMDLYNSIEQIIFNCHASTIDEMDSAILKMFVQGYTTRDIAEEVKTTKTTVGRRVDKMLGWVMCQE